MVLVKPKVRNLLAALNQAPHADLQSRCRRSANWHAFKSSINLYHRDDATMHSLADNVHQYSFAKGLV
eukprot:scaffold5900_cov89-Skeletonema_dohrnii-CCMP3373.AAC.2